MFNNPKSLPSGHFTAHIGLYCNYASYFGDYQKAVEILYRSVADTSVNPDSVALSLLFLMRHSLELGYKFTLAAVYEDAGESYVPKPDGHSLVRCHERLGKWFEKFKERNKVSTELVKDFRKYYDVARVGMHEFDRLDPLSFNFRYPTDKEGKSESFKRTEKTDLLALKSAFDAAMALLKNTADVFNLG